MPKFKFNRHELAGSFGDIGTDLPLLLALITAASLDFTSVFMMFGLWQIISGVIYRLPMPMQPLKAMAVIVISQNLNESLLLSGGFVIGILMFFLTKSGALVKLATIIPHPVIRGLQLGLALSLAKLAILNYIPKDQTFGYVIASICLIIFFIFGKNKKLPIAFIFIFIGLMIGIQNMETAFLSLSLNFPKTALPSFDLLLPALLILAIPQIPLSLANSLIATKQTVKDFYPENDISLNKLGYTYSFVNIITPFFSGAPLCHGSGGLAGHYALGARSGTSVILYGSFFILIALFFGNNGIILVKSFPFSILGVILLIEAMALIKVTKDIWYLKIERIITILVALCALLLPQGYLFGMIIGTFLYYTIIKYK